MGDVMNSLYVRAACPVCAWASEWVTVGVEPNAVWYARREAAAEYYVHARDHIPAPIYVTDGVFA